MVITAKFGAATSQAKVPSLRKVNKEAVDMGTEVVPLKIDRTYHTTAEGDPQTEVSFQDRGIAYAYGPEYVPFSTDDKKEFEMTSEKVRRHDTTSLEASTM